MSNKVTGKWVLLAVAFIVSCLIWYMVITSDDPRINISLGSIEVELLNGDVLHEKGLAYYVEGDGSVDTTVSVVQEKGWLVSAGDMRITADLSDAVSTRNVISLDVQVVNNQTIIGSNYKLSSRNITIRTEKLLEKSVPVVINTEGEPEDDCTIGEYITEKSSVKVKVPESLYDFVESAGATVEVSGRSADYEGEVELSFYDADGNVIDCDAQQIFPEEESTEVKIPIGVTRKVSVQIPSGTGSCPEGYRCTGIEVDKKTVTVLGEESLLDSLDTITISSAQISLDGKKESFEQTFDLEEYLPEGVILYDSDERELHVTVKIEKLEQKTFTIPSSQIQMINLGKNLNAEISSLQVNVVVEALPEELSELDVAQIQLTLDLDGMRAGTHQVEASCSFQNGDIAYRVISVKKATVVVTES